MPRPIWSGAISFGLINIPVKLFNTVKKKDIHFHQLRASDGCRIRLKKVCSNDGAEVPNEEIIKGYEISPDRHVVVTPQELQGINPKASRSIDIEDFVKLEQIDPIYYEQTYYLVPDKGAAKAYMLLLAAMKNTEKVAVAKFILRAKQNLATIRPLGQTLAVSTMHYADEVLPQNQLEGIPEVDSELNKRELAMAEQLIESLTTDFTPEKYHDEYRQAVLDLIERKAEGQDTVVQPAVQENGGKVVDLMSALEASLDALKKRTSDPAKPRRKKAHA